jgi:thiol-disulfide isomerase/thioredoxin
MKTTLLLSALLTSFCFGAFENWTSKDGRTAQFDLIKISGEGDSLAGEFRMKNGKSVTIKAGATKLKEAAAKAIADAKPQTTPSVFDAVLEGNLVRLVDGKLAKCEDATKPTKYYIFYYTASWCGPCQAFTPSLVKFYEDEKEGNDQFELVLISSDDDEKSMGKYATDKKMPWPQLELKSVPKFSGKFNHGVKGIPSVVVCDLEGKIVAKTRDLTEIKKLIK